MDFEEKNTRLLKESGKSKHQNYSILNETEALE